MNQLDHKFTFGWMLVAFATPLAANPLPFFQNYCIECHDADAAKGGLDLEALSVADWGVEKNSDQWERVLKRVGEGEMPPPKKKQPTSEEREAAVVTLHQRLMEQSTSDGSVMRRLNRIEYKNTIDSLLGLHFNIPDEFPPDTVDHGFDNSAVGLVLSPALMECYYDAATQAADGLFPPDTGPIIPAHFKAAPKDFAIAETAGRVVGDAMRLVARTARMADSCTWPAKFETRIPGKYQLRIAASRFAPGSVAIPIFEGPMKLRIYAQPVDNDDAVQIDKLRKLTEFEVISDDPMTFECEVELRRTETPVLYFANALISRPVGKAVAGHEEIPTFETLIREMLTRDKRLFAAWQHTEVNDGLQRGTAWAKLKKLRDAPDLDLEPIDNSEAEVAKVVKKLVKGIGFVDPVFTYQLFEEGPALEIHSVEIDGPTEVVEGEQEKKRREELVPRFLAAATATADADANTDASPEAKVRPIMDRFLSKAFRRPATEADIAKYSSIVIDHMKSGHSLEKGLHLGIRTALISPHFLYRGHRPGRLDDWDLAARLAYFLTSAPPDDQLASIAAAGKLSEPDQLVAEANRLIDSDQISRWVTNFTGQWLGLRRLEEITPDPRLIAWQNGHRKGMIGEAERFFTEILQKNLPLQTFIKPDFTWGNERLLNEIYGQKVKIPNWGFARIDVPDGATFGGLLGQAGVMMATANGTYTQPVERGVWVLGNILGDPPPPPPPGTPTIEPDTRRAKTIRELMSAHTIDTKCAACHRKIDPIGFVLENFDPLGRWRTHYPEWTKNEKGEPVAKSGAPIDARGEFTGGVQFENVDDLREYVLANIDKFGACLSEKLLTYAIGRRPNYAERHEISRIVRDNVSKSKEGAGFRDMLLELIKSEAFRTR
jgi:hypothetical protein